MPRRKRSPEENERRAKIRELLLSSNISSMEDIQDLFKLGVATSAISRIVGIVQDKMHHIT